MMKYVIVNFFVITIVCIYIVVNKICKKKEKKDWSHNLKINQKSGPFSNK